MDGQTTTYVLDLAASLTQVLDDGDSQYLHGIGRIGEDDGTDWLYHRGDALGSVRMLSDSAGATLGIHSYAPYGDTLDSEGTDSTFQFAGEQRDASGLTFLRARYLDTGTGRFATKDPSRLEANLYAYVHGNPVNRVDPSGLCWHWNGTRWINMPDVPPYTDGPCFENDANNALRDFDEKFVGQLAELVKRERETLLKKDLAEGLVNQSDIEAFEQSYGREFLDFYYSTPDNVRDLIGHTCSEGPTLPRWVVVEYLNDAPYWELSLVQNNWSIGVPELGGLLGPGEVVDVTRSRNTTITFESDNLLDFLVMLWDEELRGQLYTGVNPEIRFQWVQALV